MGKLTTALIDVNDDDETFSEKSMMPTIVFMRWSNLMAWLGLKEAVINVGFKYTWWIDLFTSFMFLMTIGYLVFVLLVFFNVINFKLSPVLWTLAIFDIVTIMSIILYMIWLGASINSLWDKEIGILIDIKRELYKISKDIDVLWNKKLYSSRLS